MIEPSPLLEVGRVSKAHGVRGEVVVELLSERLERVEPGARLFAGPRELVIVSSRPSGSPPAASRARRGSVHFVRFAGVEDRTAADALRGSLLCAEALVVDGGSGEGDDDHASWVHELIGCRVLERDGTDRGLVAAVEANPAADLLVLESGALVPMTFVEDVTEGRITIDPPAGLFE